MKSEMTKNERSALVASYDVNGVHVDIDIDFVKSYLVRGNAENITDQELVFFLNTCKSQNRQVVLSDGSPRREIPGQRAAVHAGCGLSAHPQEREREEKEPDARRSGAADNQAGLG